MDNETQSQPESQSESKSPSVRSVNSVVNPPGELIKPEPRTPVHIRLAESEGPGGERDLKFIDDLHKRHTHALGRWPLAQFRDYLKNGQVLIAETPPPRTSEGKEIPGVRGVPMGYIIGTDKYFKREDVGAIFQIAVRECDQRALIGAMLVKAMFERAAWGCRLFCCWCAQDLAANYFWESLGFVPLAFRTGSERAGRIHIFWQKRIREGDDKCPWWFPSQTTGGAIREGRLVLPIPPGTHWSDAKPMVVPGVPAIEGEDQRSEVRDQKSEIGGDENGQLTADRCPLTSEPKKRRRRKRETEAERRARRSIIAGGFRLNDAPDVAAKEEQKPGAAIRRQAKKAKPKPKEKRKYDPRYVDAARELCARYLEALQRDGAEDVLPNGAGKYDVSRGLPAADEGNGNLAGRGVKFLGAA